MISNKYLIFDIESVNFEYLICYNIFLMKISEQVVFEKHNK